MPKLSLSVARVLRIEAALLAAALCLLGIRATAGPHDGCGTGIVSGAEFCDDGNTVSGDGCSNCIYEICGDGVVEPDGEECDTGSLCEDGTTDCTVVSRPGEPGGPLGDCTGIGGETCAPRGGVGDGCSETCRFECGNGVLDPGEECDDGNRTDCDGCDLNCIPEECGNGVVGCGETCDDGNTTDGDGCPADCTRSCFQFELGPARCVLEMNARFAAVWKSAAREAARCVKEIARGKRADDPATCLASDAKGRVARAEGTTLARESRRCNPVDLPPFGYTDGAAVNMAAADGVGDALAELFGAAAVADARAERAAARCQREAAKALAKLGAVSAKRFRKAKKSEFRSLCGSPDLAELAQATLRDEKVRKLAAKTATRIARKCPAGDLAPWFGTEVDASSAAQLGATASARTLCRVCLGLAAADGYAPACDVADDGDANASCP